MADPLRKQVGNLGVARDGFAPAGLRVLPKSMLFTFSAQHAAVSPKMPEERLALHPMMSNSCFASGGRARMDSSLRCSRIRAIASRRSARHSSDDLPCPLAPGTSAQYATYHGPSRSIIAVNSLCTLPFYFENATSAEAERGGRILLFSKVKEEFEVFQCLVTVSGPP